MGELIAIKNRYGNASIAIQGAQLLSWAPEGQKSVIWLSKEAKFVKGKSYRGGIPICWPWFGPHPSDPALPAHGFARNLNWQLMDKRETEEGTLVTLAISPNESSWPYRSELEYRIKVGEQLELELVTRNRGSDPFVLGCALHTYFQVSDVRNVKVLGLEGARYVDKVKGGEKVQEGALTIESEVDRIYLDTTSSCVIQDPGMNRSIRIEKSGSRSTVVWNPWIEKSGKLGDMGADGYLGMLCVETCNAHDDVVTVPPSGEHCLKAVYSLCDFSIP